MSSVLYDDLVIGITTPANVSYALIQADDYYPFGLPMGQDDAISAGLSDKNKFLYQGKEWQTQLALNIYDFHARQYDPATGRMLGIDPKAISFAGLSPYSGMGNSPMMVVDPDGEFLNIIIGAVVGGVANWISHGITSGDWFDQGALQAFGTGAAIGALAGATGVGASAALSGSTFSSVAAGSAVNAAGSAVSIGFGATVAGGAAAGAIGGGMSVLSNNNLFDGNWNTNAEDIATGMAKGAVSGAISSSVRFAEIFGHGDTGFGFAAREITSQSLAGGASGFLTNGMNKDAFFNGLKNGAIAGAINVSVAATLSLIKNIEFPTTISEEHGNIRTVRKHGPCKFPINREGKTGYEYETNVKVNENFDNDFIAFISPNQSVGNGWDTAYTIATTFLKFHYIYH